MQTGRAGLPTNLALAQSSYAAWPPGSRVSITLPMGFATSWLSGLSNAGKPKHSFVIAVRRAKEGDAIGAGGDESDEALAQGEDLAMASLSA